MQSFSWYQLSPGLALLCSCCHIDCKLKPWLKFINIYTSKRVLRLYQKWWKLETMLFGQHSYGFSLTSSPSTMQYPWYLSFILKVISFECASQSLVEVLSNTLTVMSFFEGRKGLGVVLAVFGWFYLVLCFITNQQKGSWRYQIWLC